MKLSIAIISAVTLGIVLGSTITIAAETIQALISGLLGLVLLGVGIDLGSNRAAWSKLREWNWRIILIPFTIAIASLFATGMAGLLMGFTLKEGLAIGAGFGWYSLSAGLITSLHSPVLGAIALLTNIFREITALLIIPLVAKHLGNLAAIAPGGATTMDTSLPVVAKATDGQVTPIAFFSGVVLTILVPFLVPFILSF